MTRIAIPLSLLLAACAPAPEIDASRFDGRIPPPPEETPRLAPIEAPPPPRLAADRGVDPGRADALRDRAARLSTPVIPAAERLRLDRAGAARPNGTDPVGTGRPAPSTGGPD